MMHGNVTSAKGAAPAAGVTPMDRARHYARKALDAGLQGDTQGRDMYRRMAAKHLRQANAPPQASSVAAARAAPALDWNEMTSAEKIRATAGRR